MFFVLFFWIFLLYLPGGGGGGCYRGVSIFPLFLQGIMEKDNWEAAEWTIPLLAEKYPLMQVKVGADSDNSPIQMNMADFARYDTRY